MPTTFGRLKSGQWGVRTDSDTAQEGQEVTVQKKDGTTTVVRLGALDHRYGEVAVFAIAKAMPFTTRRLASAPPVRRRAFYPCGYPGCNPGHCDECEGEGMYAR